jgi:hypothetical protein
MNGKRVAAMILPTLRIVSSVEIMDKLLVCADNMVVPYFL